MEGLGQSQILPYLRGLAAWGSEVTLLSFEKRGNRQEVRRCQSLEAELSRNGIRWLRLTYHKTPTLLATSFDILAGVALGSWVVLRHRPVLVHARSYVAALMAWQLKRLYGVKFLFDMRGFWADERVEGGLWPAGGRLFRLAKRWEQRFLADADHIVTLTDRSRRTVEQWPGIRPPGITVIPTCVDLGRFVRTERTPGREESSLVFIYVGSLGTWYLYQEMLQLFKAAIERGPARLVVLTHCLDEAVRGLAEVQVPAEQVVVSSARPETVPDWLGQAQVGLAFYKPGWSRQATCPTKIGEYLAMGLPVIVNHDVGDVCEVVGHNRVGVVVSEFSTHAYRLALDELAELRADPDLSSRCRQVAETHFSLQLGVGRYWTIYQELARSA